LRVLLDPRISSPAVEYTFNTLLKDFLGIDFAFAQKGNQSDFPCVYYGCPENCRSPADIRIYCSDFLLNGNYLKKGFLPSPPLARYRGEELREIINTDTLPVLFLARQDRDEKNTPYVRFEPKTNTVETNIDIIASSFFMLTRIEELVSPAADEHGRYPPRASIASRDGFLQRPIVNEYLELLWFWLKKVEPALQRGRRSFKLVLTHDVDYIRRGTLKTRLKAVGAQLVKYRSPRGFLQAVGRNLIWLFTYPRDPFEFIRRTTREFGLKSHFFFIANGKSTTYDRNRYDIGSEQVKGIVRRLEEDGHHIGLHCSYSSFLNPMQLMVEKKLLEELVHEEIRGCRSHYLRLRVPDSFALLEKLGFAFDSTLGYDEALGFRAGTCYPFKPFDVRQNRVLNLREYPLMTTDTTLTAPKLRTERTVRDVTRLLIEQIGRVHFFSGSFVFLVHVDAFEEVDFPWRNVLVEVLRHCQNLRTGVSRKPENGSQESPQLHKHVYNVEQRKGRGCQ